MIFLMMLVMEMLMMAAIARWRRWRYLNDGDGLSDDKYYDGAIVFMTNMKMMMMIPLSRLSWR